MIRLSNRDVPARDRLSYLHDFVARSVAGLQFTPRESDDFMFDVSCLELDGDVVVGSARYSSLRGERTRELIADGRENWMLTIHDRDYEVTLGNGQELRVSGGDIVIVSEDLRQTFMLPSTRLRALVLDRRRMLEMAPAIGRRAYHHVPAAMPGVSLLSGYIRLLLDGPSLGAPGTRLAADQLHQLAAAALGGRDEQERTKLSGIARSRLALVKDYLARHLTEPDIDIADVARRQQVTPRYMQRLFEREGTTFSRFLRDSRLDLAHQTIEAGDGRSISAIAFDCGFGDLSHFNKVFRQRFGVAPRDIKASAMRRMQ
ncbi:MAG: AraC family transcriptional regulator [Mesorhizobium sp.]